MSKNINIIYKQDKLNKVPTTWDSVYLGNNGKWEFRKEKQEISKKLHKLTSPIQESDVINIIGNNSWTSFECDICEIEANKLINFSSDFYDAYNNWETNICESCLEKALQRISDEK